MTCRCCSDKICRTKSVGESGSPTVQTACNLDHGYHAWISCRVHVVTGKRTQTRRLLRNIFRTRCFTLPKHFSALDEFPVWILEWVAETFEGLCPRAEPELERVNAMPRAAFRSPAGMSLHVIW